MDAVQARLNTAHGIKLSTPGYDGYDPDVGGITTYPPGAKENGGVFLHTNPWAVIAETMLGDGDRAYAYISRINPAAANERADEYECEPYVYPQNILADEHPQAGLARNSWLTGTAASALQAAVQHLLGLRPTHTGLRIDPCLPTTWDGYRARRRFRGAWYDVLVKNPQHVCRGIRSIFLNEQPISSACLPIPQAGERYRVEVELGSPD